MTSKELFRMKSTDRMFALARYYKLITTLEAALKRSFRDDAVGLDDIVRNVRVAHAFHAARRTEYAGLLYHAQAAGKYALKVERHMDVAHNARRLHASLDSAVAA